MAIDKGNIKTSANYDVKAQKPLDARAVRPAKADLIKKESWSADGSTVYAYEGMQVYVQDEKKTYYLKDITKMFASDFSGWELMGTGAGSGITEEKEVYIGSDTPPKGTKVWIDPQGTPSSPSQPSAGVEVIDNLESDSATAALSANQGRVLKEMIAGGGQPSASSILLYYDLMLGVTDEMKAVNAASVTTLMSNWEQGVYNANVIVVAFMDNVPVLCCNACRLYVSDGALDVLINTGIGTGEANKNMMFASQLIFDRDGNMNYGND